jgi:hypothetical protein
MVSRRERITLTNFFDKNRYCFDLSRSRRGGFISSRGSSFTSFVALFFEVFFSFFTKTGGCTAFLAHAESSFLILVCTIRLIGRTVTGGGSDLAWSVKRSYLSIGIDGWMISLII